MLNPWTSAEKRAFERALGTVPDDAPNRWEQITANFPDRSLEEIRERFQLLVLDVKHIEDGPAPDYIDDWVPELVANSSSSSQTITKSTSPNQSAKKKLWRNDEHKNFLMGLMEYGKGQWKNISRKWIPTKTTTQIASHAQKFYLHQDGTPKRRKRASIHDLTIDETDLVPQQNQVPQLDALLQQLSPQQNWVHLDAPMQQLQEMQHTLGDSGLASQQLMVPPLDAPMQQSQERQHTIGDNVMASQQHLVPPLEVMPMQQLQERPQGQAIDSRNCAWKPVGNREQAIDSRNCVWKSVGNRGR